ncbi:MAG: hypothetical protein HS108_05320 [Planctomycetes bacterium]|jgi:hypothetical protein|nr:hypothetical protein [Planctomycetota bacterium]MCL4730098.1 hypothetical protein [Planctomycetota bacterium]
MKTTTCLPVLLLCLLLAACGGGNNAPAGSNTGSSTNAPAEPAKNEPPKPDPAKDRQAVADTILKAYTSLDSSGVLALFKPEEHEKAKSRMVREIDDIKKKGGSVKVAESKIEEREGKFFLVATLDFDVAGEKSSKTREAQMIQHEGKWYLSFER